MCDVALDLREVGPALRERLCVAALLVRDLAVGPDQLLDRLPEEPSMGGRNRGRVEVVEARRAIQPLLDLQLVLVLAQVEAPDQTRDEVDEIARQYPERSSYLDVYDYFGLLRKRAVFAHCLHMNDSDRSSMAAKGGAAAFCPTSNLFLGSGLFDLPAMRAAGVRCGLGTDVGGGTSMSLLKTASEAYKVLHLQEHALPATRALYLATLGAAEALYLDDCVGNFLPGKEADFIVLDAAGSSMTARRVAAAGTVDEKLFAMITLGDDRNISATYDRAKQQTPAKSPDS